MHIAYCFLIAFIIRVFAGTLNRKFKAFKKPLLTCFLESLFAIPQTLRLGPWSKGNSIRTAVRAAMKNTKLTDLGGSDNGEGMINRYETTRRDGFAKTKGKLKYSSLGHVMSIELMTKRVETRLKLVDYMKRHPDIEKRASKMRSPIFVIGFPRTGTTFLHELLGLHPRVRMHYTWEQMEPVPRTHDESPEAIAADCKKRFEGNRFKFDLMLTLAGDSVQSIHRVGYEEPEECTTPCAVELPWAINELPFNVFAAESVINLGAGDAFKFYKQFLLLLSWVKDKCHRASNPSVVSGKASSQGEQEQEQEQDDFTWMLKCPFHLPYLSELYETFPGATVVWTHRNPVECIASACSLYETLLTTAMEGFSIDKEAIGAAVLDYTKRSLDKAFASLDQIKKNKALKLNVIHVRYANNVKNPKKICKHVIESSGLAYDSQYVTLIDEYLDKNEKQRQKLKAKGGGDGKKLHDYTLEEYGLSEEKVKEIFKDYIEDYC